MADLVTAYVDRLPDVLRATPAVVETVSPLTVTIDGATTPAVSWLPNWEHLATDRVLILRGRGRVEIVGTLAVRPTSAIVGSVAGALVTVTDGDGRTFTLPRIGAAPAIGATVGIVWGSGGGFIAGVLSTTAPGTAPGTDAPTDPNPPDLPSAIQPGTVTQAATWSGTARSGSWRSDGFTLSKVYQGHFTTGSTADNSGFWGYGRGLAVAGATASSGGTIRLRRDDDAGAGAAVPVYLTLHGAHDKPGSPPAILSGPVVVGSLARNGVSDPPFGLPSGWAQSLLNGTAGGVGVSYAGTPHYAAFLGPAADPSAALISLPYTRAS